MIDNTPIDQTLQNPPQLLQDTPSPQRAGALAGIAANAQAAANQVTQAQPPNSPQQDDNAEHPAVKHASVLRSIAETLAGGPRFKPVIDATGKTKYERVPLDRKDIGMALAISALMGGIAGLQAKGPNANAQAAGLGFNAVASAREKQDEDAKKQANEDFVRQAAVADTNFRLHQNAVNLGHQDYENHKEYVADHKSTFDALSQVPGAIRADNVREGDLTKYHVTKDTAVPVGVLPRLNSDGSQATDQYGAPLWDNTYAVVDPEAHITLPDDVVKLLASYGVAGYVKNDGTPVNLGANAELKAKTVLRGLAQASAIKIAQANLNGQAKQVLGERAAPVDLRSAIKSDPTFIDALQEYQRYAAFPIDEALEMMAKDKNVDPSSVGKITNFVGQDFINSSRLKHEADDERTKAQARVSAETAGKAAQEAPEIESLAQALAKGDLTSLKDVTSLRGDQRAKVYTRVKQLNPNFNTSDVKLKVDTQEAFSKGKQGDQIQSFNTFLGHAGEAADASAAYRRESSPLVNKPLNWLEKNAANDATYQTFITALQPVRDEYMTFLQNNHALTEADKKAGETIMSNDSTPAQVEASLKQMAKTAFIRLDALNDRYKRVMGADFPDLLNEDAKGAANTLGLGAHATKYQSGGRVTGSASGVLPGNTAQPQPKAGFSFSDYPEAK
jgi:hypothetical protein